jgi:hypothetical protein
MTSTVFLKLREEYHKKICDNILGYRPGSTVLSVADGSSQTSKTLAAKMAEKIGKPLCTNPKMGQTAGTLFTQYTYEFLRAAFERLQHLRPGDWYFSTSQAAPGIASFDQYEHLAALEILIREHKELSATIGVDYLITPDIIVARRPVGDEEINSQESLVIRGEVAKYTPLRSVNYDTPRDILHASISCKWTMRSDRAQNTRTEALNLIRNRKGKTPHIVAVTFEPMPSRLASIAMGTGDVDCTYHGALYELMEAVREIGNEDQAEILQILVDGRRLRDISDLPFDLAI